MEGRCQDCRWWQHVDTNRIHTRVGICRRMPPTAYLPTDWDLLDRRGIAVWPTMREGDWCGEYQDRKEK